MHYMDDLIRQRGVSQPKTQSSKFFFIQQKVFLRKQSDEKL